jgi:hypothetical protein
MKRYLRCFYGSIGDASGGWDDFASVLFVQLDHVHVARESM